jgi:acetyl-CoA/propionyl-CoA carboxylase carboxyl transferase subunit
MLAQHVDVGVSDLVARRFETLLDAGSMRLQPDDESGVVSGTGTIGGVPVSVFATDPARAGGALGARGCERIARTIDDAVGAVRPVVGIWQSGGARLQEGVASLDGMGRVFAATVRASGRAPQVSVILGAAAGGAAYGPALTDVVIFGPGARVFVTGPDVVRSVTGEDVDAARLGGPDPHTRRSGLAHIAAADDESALQSARDVVELLAAPGVLRASDLGPGPELAALLPASPRRAYDVRPLVTGVADPGSWVELHAAWAPNVVVGLGRLAGRSIGIVANNPLRLGGCLDASAAEKAARFVRLCDSFAVPLVVLVDVPGYLPGAGQEWDGVVRRGAKLLYAFAECTVPRVTVVTRKAFGGAYIAMNSRALGASAVFAWADADVAVMGAAAAVGILHRRELAAADDDARAELTAALVEQHVATAGGIARAQALGVVDAVIEPANTRRAIATAIGVAPPGRRGHGNIPL